MLTLEKYLTKRRIDNSWGSARYVKATEYRVTMEDGTHRSFWSLKEANKHIASTIVSKGVK
jgi:hypothetical protein